MALDALGVEFCVRVLEDWGRPQMEVERYHIWPCRGVVAQVDGSAAAEGRVADKFD